MGVSWVGGWSKKEKKRKRWTEEWEEHGRKRKDREESVAGAGEYERDESQ